MIGDGVEFLMGAETCCIPPREVHSKLSNGLSLRRTMGSAASKLEIVASRVLGYAAGT